MAFITTLNAYAGDITTIKYKILTQNGKVYAIVKYEENTTYKETTIYPNNNLIAKLIGLMGVFKSKIELDEKGEVEYKEFGKKIDLKGKITDPFRTLQKLGIMSQYMNKNDEIQTKMYLVGKLEDIIATYKGREKITYKKDDKTETINAYKIEMKPKDKTRTFYKINRIEFYYNPKNLSEIKYFKAYSITGETYIGKIDDKKIKKRKEKTPPGRKKLDYSYNQKKPDINNRISKSKIKIDNAKNLTGKSGNKPKILYKKKH